MAQHDYIIANQSGAAFRADLNVALAAVATNNSQDTGTSQPDTTYRFQWWADPGTGLLKIRNAANNAWITVGTLADANLGLLSLAGGTLTGALLLDDSGTVSAPALAFDGDANTGIWRSAADTLNVATNGVENLEFGTSEVVFNDGGADIDFRIEGDTKANLFKVDAGTDAVSIDGDVTIANQNDLRFGDSDNSNWVALQAPATVSSNVTFTLPAADGTADQSIVTDGSGALSFAARSRLVSGTSVASTSGTSIDFTSIPSWVKKITVMLYGVSTNGTSPVQIQLGDSGGVETTGYTSSLSVISGANICSISQYTSGFIPPGATIGATRSGLLTVANLAVNVWIASGTFNDADFGAAGCVQGFKDLSGTLDRVRITTINGTDTFDAGSINILYEG